MAQGPPPGMLMLLAQALAKKKLQGGGQRPQLPAQQGPPPGMPMGPPPQ